MDVAAAAQERLRTERNLWLTTVRPDGRPHVAPVWFVYVAERLWIGTGITAVRVANVRANPAAAIHLQDGDRPIVAEGRATLHVDARPAEVVAAFEQKYGWDVSVEEDRDVGTLVLLEISPQRWLFDVPLPTFSADGDPSA